MNRELDGSESGFHTYRARCDDAISGDCLLLTADLGFHIRHQVYAHLFGVDADATHGVPDDTDEARRGTSQKEFVTDWLTAAEMSYTGDDSYPLCIQTLLDRDHGRQVYQTTVYSRETLESLNDQLLMEYPDIADL